MQRNIIPGIVREQEIVALDKSSSVHDAVQAMSNHRIAAIAVTDNATGKLVGIVSERDMTHRVLACGLNPQSTPLSDVMTENPTTLRSGDDALDAVELMLVRNFRHLPVVNESGIVIAMVSMRDLLKAALIDLKIDLDVIQEAAFASEESD
jgi:CBS domain-containing protein